MAIEDLIIKGLVQRTIEAIDHGVAISEINSSCSLLTRVLVEAGNHYASQSKMELAVELYVQAASDNLNKLIIKAGLDGDLDLLDLIYDKVLGSELLDSSEFAHAYWSIVDKLVAKASELDPNNASEKEKTLRSALKAYDRAVTILDSVDNSRLNRIYLQVLECDNPDFRFAEEIIARSDYKIFQGRAYLKMAERFYEVTGNTTTRYITSARK